MATRNGTPGNDNLIGTPKKDLMRGYAGKDSLTSGGGNDKLTGGSGDDTLTGGGGYDIFVFNNIRKLLYLSTDNGSYVKDLFVYSTDGLDTIKNYNGGEDSIINVKQGKSSPYHVPIEPVAAPGDGSLDSEETNYIYGTAGSDTIEGTSGDNNIYGWATDGNANSPSGNDKLYGNDSNDELYGGTGDDSLYGLAGNDNLYGGQDNDYLSGEDNSDELYGEAGNDTLDGGDLYDVLIGGTGNDTYIVDIIIEDSNITEYLNEGTDTVKSPFSDGLGDNLENLTLTGSSDISGLGNALDNRIDGNAGQNFLVGGDGNDHLLGYDDYDILVGEAGNDTLSGDAGDDALNGGSGSDMLTGGAGADTFVFSSRFDGIDSITDFNLEEGDKIEVSASELGIGQYHFDKFTFNSSTGALFFEQTQFASLQPGEDFDPSFDITIV